MNQQPVSPQDLFAIIGEKEVQLALLRGTITQLQARIAELEGKQS